MTTMQSHGLALRRAAAWSLAFGVLVLGGCGGGGSSGSLPLVVPPAPPAPTAQINGSNYLDAAAVGSVGRSRALELASLIDFSFSVAASTNFTSAVFPCGAGGTWTVTVSSASANTGAPANCNLGTILLSSGSIAGSNLEYALSGTPPRNELSRGTYRVLDLVSRALPGDGINQTYGADLQVARQSASSVNLTGQFSVLRLGRPDSYPNANLAVTKVGNTVVSTGFRYDINSPRFSSGPLRASTQEGSTPSLRVDAPDGSNVRVATVTAATASTPAQLRFEVFANATTTTPSVTQTLAENDPQVVAAITRALQ
jgi:hypothetical protein